MKGYCKVSEYCYLVRLVAHIYRSRCSAARQDVRCRGRRSILIAVEGLTEYVTAEELGGSLPCLTGLNDSITDHGPVLILLTWSLHSQWSYQMISRLHDVVMARTNPAERHRT